MSDEAKQAREALAPWLQVHESTTMAGPMGALARYIESGEVPAPSSCPPMRLSEHTRTVRARWRLESVALRASLSGNPEVKAAGLELAQRVVKGDPIGS